MKLRFENSESKNLQLRFDILESENSQFEHSEFENLEFENREFENS